MKKMPRLAFVLCSLVIFSSLACAEAREVRIAKQYGLSYLPLMVLEDQKLIEKQAKAAGLGDVKVTWATLSSGSAMNEALLSGSVDFVSAGVPPFITLWAKTKGAVKALAPFDSGDIWFNSNNPKVKTIRDLTEQDRIALPAPKVGIQAVLLQMAAAKEFGDAAYDKFDHLTVSMSHPDGAIALLSGRSQITAHITSSPFIYQELKDPKIHKVFDSFEVLEGPHTFNVLYSRQKFYDENAKLNASVFAALEEAVAYIGENREGAAEIYLRLTKSGESKDQILTYINKGNDVYTTTPQNTTKFTDFMFRIKTIDRKPNTWKDLFFPVVYSKAGS
jgi:NitT/TauT family transport system substrate-binding protein